MEHPDSFSDSLTSVEWEFIAQALVRLESGVEPRDAASRKLRAHLGMVRIITYEKIRRWNGESTIDGSFLVATIKSVRRLEKEFNAMGIKKREFLIFLKLLLSRFEKQKLKVKKPHALRSEFRKMKGVVENEHGPL